MGADKGKLYDSAQSCIRKGNWKKALSQLEKLQSLEKSDPLVPHWMGDLLIKLGRRDDALKSYLKAATLFGKQGHVPKAVATYKLMMRLDPTLIGVEDKIGELLAGQKAAPKPAEPREPGLLFDLSPEDTWELMGRMKMRSFEDGDVIVREGEEGSSLFVVRKGKVRVTTRVDGRELVLARLGERDFFGEVSLLTGMPRTADIAADGPAEVMELCREDLDEIMKKHPNVEGFLRMFHESRVSDTIESFKAFAKDLFK